MHIAILGNGISGVTAARFIRKQSNHKITLISAETDHFFSRTALMYVYMGHMRFKDIKPYEDWFWEKNRIDLINGFVGQIDFESKVLKFSDRDSLTYDKLIIAVGSKSNKFGWPGQDLDGVGGLYSLQDLELMEEKTNGLKRAVIVGGGLIGIEMAEMFHSRDIPVTFLVREKSYWNIVLPPEESKMINRHILENHIDLRLETELKEILSDRDGGARAIITNKDDEINCQYVGLTAGVSPNIAWLKNGALECQKGILVDEFLQTNIPDVYAIGDCAQLREPPAGRRPIEAVWYVGRIMGETVAYNVCGEQVKYDPGIWFNSAKFFDIEYQVYGSVPANIPEEISTLYWEHKNRKASIRLLYDSSSKEITGFNLMGVRYRHEVCEKWLKDKTHIEDVLKDLGLANFDPEFYKEYEEEVIALYNQHEGTSISLSNKRGWDPVAFFLGKNRLGHNEIQQKSKTNLLIGMVLIAISLLIPLIFKVKIGLMIIVGVLLCAGIGLAFVALNQWMVFKKLKG